MAKLIKRSFFIWAHGLPPPKVGFESSALDMRKTGLYSSGVGGFQTGDLASKIGGVIGADHKLSKV